MNKLKGLLFLLMTFGVLSVSAQDVIVRRDGDELQCKILEVSKNEVRYKRWTNQEGPAFTEKKSDIFMIKYENGEKDVMNNGTPALEAPSADLSKTTSIEPTPLSDIYLVYTPCGKRKSGIIKWGRLQTDEQAQEILTTDWISYRDAREKERTGKAMIFTGIPCMVWFGAGTPLLIVGIIKAKRGHRNATQIVNKHIDEYEQTQGKTSMSKPEFDVDARGNNLVFSLKF